MSFQSAERVIMTQKVCLFTQRILELWTFSLMEKLWSSLLASQTGFPSICKTDRSPCLLGGLFWETSEVKLCGALVWSSSSQESLREWLLFLSIFCVVTLQTVGKPHFMVLWGYSSAAIPAGNLSTWQSTKLWAQSGCSSSSQLTRSACVK